MKNTCLSLLGTLFLLAGCGEDESTALRLKLVVDPQLNSEAQVLGVIDTIELVLDTPGGFPATGGEGELQSRNLDSDPDLELVLTKRVAAQSSFPMLRLLPGNSLDKQFQITARGMVGTQVAAVGGSALARFSEGMSPELSVPLNLRPAYRAPRVVMSLPHDGQHAVPQGLSNIYVEFSKWVAGPSVQRNLRLVHKSAAGEKEMPGTWKLVNMSVNELGFPEERTAATFQRSADCFLATGEFRIEALPAITDDSGVALDQDALQPGATGFNSTFTVAQNTNAAASTTMQAPLPAVSGDDACVPVAPKAYGCQLDADCNPTGGTSFVCLIASGACVANSDSCGTCPAGMVCGVGSAVKSAPELAYAGMPNAACVADCRKNGGACQAGRCDFVTGLCLPCLPSVGTNVTQGCNIECAGVTGGCPLKTYCDVLHKTCVPCAAGDPACF